MTFKRKRKMMVKKFFLLFLLSQCLISCDDKKEYSRSDYLIISETKRKEDITSKIFCNISGGLDTLYVFSNVEYEVFFQSDEEDWVKIISEEHMSDLGATRLIIEINPMGDFDYRRRTSSLSFSSKENYLGQFISLVQGFNTRLDETFSWLRYGMADPLDEQRETLIGNWSVSEKENEWTASDLFHDGIAYTYGKNGYVKLGSETKIGDLVTPYLTGMANDSVLLVSLDAIAYISPLNVKDNNRLTVNILSGGQFQDKSTSKTFELNYYDPVDDDLVLNMWKDGHIEFYVISDLDNPISGTTRFQFIAGDGEPVDPEADYGQSRVFIDNVAIYVVNEDYYYLVK